MIATPITMAVPLRTDDDGKIRVVGTRILLELIVYAYRQGETPEGIVDSYSILKLADVYAIIAYYLAHRAEVDAYVRQVEERGEQNLREIEANYSPEARALDARLHEMIQHKEP